ncbi:MAG: pentapeptide repeat-containing protein, partial [Cyanobacteria bacterium P01_A01_bin.83]
AKLNHAILRHSNLANANLTNTVLVGANLCGVDLQQAHLKRTKLKSIISDYATCTLKDRHTQLSAAKLSNQNNLTVIQKPATETLISTVPTKTTTEQQKQSKSNKNRGGVLLITIAITIAVGYVALSQNFSDFRQDKLEFVKQQLQYLKPSN